MSGKKRKSFSNPGMLEDAKYVVGIDFGTTFTGFAYAAKANPEKVFSFYEWPYPDEAPKMGNKYCKTQTSLWYRSGKLSGTYRLQDWGWPAQFNYVRGLPNRKALGFYRGVSDEKAPHVGHFLTEFKLHLVDAAVPDSKLPKGLSVQRMVSDYLKELSILIMNDLRKNFGPSVQKRDIKWCLTVPTIWTDAQKQTMKDCAEKAGLVRGHLCQEKEASVHDIRIVLEPEAASTYCLQKLKGAHLRKGSKFLVVDAGGGTVDLVVHEKVHDSGLTVKELTCSTGDLCGSAFVDAAFMAYLRSRISCFEKFSCQETIFAVKRYWEKIKCGFDGEQSQTLEVPCKLAEAWETSMKARGSGHLESQYDEICITAEKMKEIFEEVVCKILKLIRDQFTKVPQIEVIMVTGGFSNSPYLMKRICGRFSPLVNHIMSPPDPASAVCRGAVTYGLLGKDIMMSRKSRQTYGIAMLREFLPGDPPGSQVLADDGETYCKDSFCVFTRVGDDVPVDHCVTHSIQTMNKGDRYLKLVIYASSYHSPKFVTDPGVAKVGSWSVILPPGGKKRNKKPEVDVTMYFGRTRIELSAKPRDASFVGGKAAANFSVVFDREYVNF